MAHIFDQGKVNKMENCDIANEIHKHYHQTNDMPRERATSSSELGKLAQHCAFGAFLHASERGTPPNVNPRTRERLLATIYNWFQGGGDLPSVMWIRGSAGAGKTALVQATAENIERTNREQILGCHFFFRTSSNGHRGEAERWAPGLAHQMTLALPETLPHVQNVIKNDDGLFELQIDRLLNELFVRPLNSILGVKPVAEKPRFPFPAWWRAMFTYWLSLKKFVDVSAERRLVVVDGLDEVNSRDKQDLIIKAIAKAIPNLLIPVRFLIASRPETNICNAIEGEFQKFSFQMIDLDKDQDAASDLKVFYDDSFDHLRRTHPALKGRAEYVEWPPEEAVSVLVMKSSPQFIFASTVMKYISQLRGHPSERLERVLKAEMRVMPHNDQPYRELDALYSVILLSVDEEDQQMVRLILTLVYHAGKGDKEFGEKLSGSPLFLENLLQLRPGDVSRLLDALVSLLTIPINPRHTIKMLHASFFDYFQNPQRSDRIGLLSVQVVHTKLAIIKFPGFIDRDSERFSPFLYHVSKGAFSLEIIMKCFWLIEEHGHKAFIGSNDKKPIMEAFLRSCSELKTGGSIRFSLVGGERSIKLILQIADEEFGDDIVSSLSKHLLAFPELFERSWCCELAIQLILARDREDLYRMEFLEILDLVFANYIRLPNRGLLTIITYLTDMEEMPTPIGKNPIPRKHIRDRRIQWEEIERAIEEHIPESPR